MGAGAYAELLAGNCLVTPTRFCMPFKEFCVHTLGSSPPLATFPDSGLFGCNAYSTNAGTQLLDDPRIPDALTRHPLYGNTTSSVTLPTYFSAADLAPWRERKIIGPMDPYNNRASGPAVRQAHMYTMVRRRLKRAASPNNGNYVNRSGFYFTDAATAYSNQQDWLGFLHPGMYLWTNKDVSEPLNAIHYYEDSGTNPVYTDTYNKQIIPFCSPVNTYSPSGTLLGQYVGYTMLFVFGMAYLKYPIPGFKPTDYYSTSPTPPEVTPTFQFFSIDCHLFMVGSPAPGKTLKSPKIGSSRYWTYNKDGTTWNICDQYMYMLCGAFRSNWKFNVVFNHVGGGNETILFNMSNLNAYVTP